VKDCAVEFDPEQAVNADKVPDVVMVGVEIVTVATELLAAVQEPF